MILHVDEDGLSEVRITSEKSFMIVAATVAELLTNIDGLELAVVELRRKMGDGLEVSRKFVGGKELTADKVRERVAKEQPAKEEDIPSFVKRSLND